MQGTLTPPEAFQVFITIFKQFHECEINNFMPANQCIYFVLNETGI